MHIKMNNDPLHLVSAFKERKLVLFYVTTDNVWEIFHLSALIFFFAQHTLKKKCEKKNNDNNKYWLKIKSDTFAILHWYQFLFCCCEKREKLSIFMTKRESEWVSEWVRVCHNNIIFTLSLYHFSDNVFDRINRSEMAEIRLKLQLKVETIISFFLTPSKASIWENKAHYFFMILLRNIFFLSLWLFDAFNSFNVILNLSPRVRFNSPGSSFLLKSLQYCE
jgi:hypothetical protein